jgi:hypothetical protein
MCRHQSASYLAVENREAVDACRSERGHKRVEFGVEHVSVRIATVGIHDGARFDGEWAPI